MQFFVINNVFSDKIGKPQKQQIKNRNKNPCRSQGLNPEPLAPKADALLLNYRVN